MTRRHEKFMHPPIITICLGPHMKNQTCIPILSISGSDMPAHRNSALLPYETQLNASARHFPHTTLPNGPTLIHPTSTRRSLTIANQYLPLPSSERVVVYSQILLLKPLFETTELITRTISPSIILLWTPTQRPHPRLPLCLQPLPLPPRPFISLSHIPSQQPDPTRNPRSHPTPITRIPHSYSDRRIIGRAVTHPDMESRVRT